MPKRVSIGLDIGSSAVRAAEVVIDGNHKVLRRFAQVGLPQGAVVEGEVQDKVAVTAALKRLWQQGRFSGKKVVIGLGSQRGMVRQVEMPPMPDGELRSALQFKIGEFLPIPVDQALVDFAPLPGNGASDGGRRLLLVAAQREVVVDQVAAVEAAGLRVGAVDSSSLALLRAVAQPKGPAGGSSPGGGLEAVVGIGAELITVAVRDGGEPRFVRTVALPGLSSRESLAGALASVPSIGDRSRPEGRTASPPGLSNAARLDGIVNEVRSSLEYLLSQSQTRHFEQVLLTGGGALLAGVPAALSKALGLPVGLAELPFEIDKKSLGLDKEALDEAASRWLTAAGLALWSTDAYGRPSLLPPEVSIRRRQRRVLVGAGAAVLVVALGLGGVSYSRIRSADDISSQIRTATNESVVLEQKIKGLGYVLEIPAEVQSRRGLAVQALTGDIDWTGLLQRLAAALPADVKVGSVTLTKTEGTVPDGTSVAADAIVGQLTMTAVTNGGAPAVARFIDRVAVVRGLAALWVSSTSGSTGLTSMQATAQITAAAFSNRAQKLPGGK